MTTQAEIVENLKNTVHSAQERARSWHVQRRVLSGTASALRWQSEGLMKLAGSIEGWASKLEQHPLLKREDAAPATPATPAS